MSTAPHGQAPASIALQWKLLDQFFAASSTGSALATQLPRAIQIVIFGFALWLQTRMPVILLWTLLALTMLLTHTMLVHAYNHCDESDSPAKWLSRFVICTWSTAAVWSTLSLLIVAVADPLTHFIVVCAQSTYLGSSLSRTSGVRRAALGQIWLLQPLLALACFATRQPVYMLWGVVTLLEMVVLYLRVELTHNRVVKGIELHEQLAVSRDELEVANRKLEAMVTTDGLNGITNRRGFDVAMRREWRRGSREHRPVSLLVIDLDYFKKLNDTLGHQAGDDCLRQVAMQLNAQTHRAVDVVARYGGEEFVAVLPDTDSFAARQIAETMRACVVALCLPHPSVPGGIATVSVGCATMVPNETILAATLIQRADEALYAAKQSGRNRVVCWEVQPARSALSLVREAGARYASKR